MQAKGYRKKIFESHMAYVLLKLTCLKISSIDENRWNRILNP